MQKFQFQTVCKKGSKIPTDYLSQNIVNSIAWQNLLQWGQDAEPLIKALWDHLLSQHLPVYNQLCLLVLFFAKDSFV
jgi:hypothetical protein